MSGVAVASAGLKPSYVYFADVFRVFHTCLYFYHCFLNLYHYHTYCLTCTLFVFNKIAMLLYKSALACLFACGNVYEKSEDPCILSCESAQTSESLRSGLSCTLHFTVLAPIHATASKIVTQAGTTDRLDPRTHPQRNYQ